MIRSLSYPFPRHRPLRVLCPAVDFVQADNDEVTVKFQWQYNIMLTVYVTAKLTKVDRYFDTISQFLLHYHGLYEGRKDPG